MHREQVYNDLWRTVPGKAPTSAKAQSELGVTFRSARLTLQDTLAWLRRAGHVA